MQSGGSLRIGTELVDVATGSQLWGAQYDRKPGDIFVVQDEISDEISGKVAATSHPSRKEATNKAPHAECRGLPALPEGSPPLEPLDRRRFLQGNRALSAGNQERSHLRFGLRGSSRLLCAAGMEQLSSAEGSIP